MNKLLTKLIIAALTVVVSTIPTLAFAQKTEKWVDVQNTTSTTITRVRFKETWHTNDNWSEDVLPGTLGYYETRRVRISSDRCTIDIWVHYANGIDDTGQFDICRATRIIAVPNGRLRVDY